METKFNSSLFEKKIDLKANNPIYGGSSSACTYNSYDSGGCQYDATSENYDENGNLTSRCTITFAPC